MTREFENISTLKSLLLPLLKGNYKALTRPFPLFLSTLDGVAFVMILSKNPYQGKSVLIKLIIIDSNFTTLL
jgi:hypothetical protein